MIVNTIGSDNFSAIGIHSWLLMDAKFDRFHADDKMMVIKYVSIIKGSNFLIILSKMVVIVLSPGIIYIHILSPRTDYLFGHLWRG